jgi:hypothetical protein
MCIMGKTKGKFNVKLLNLSTICGTHRVANVIVIGKRNESGEARAASKVRTEVRGQKTESRKSKN